MKLVDNLIGGYPLVADIKNIEITKFIDSQGDEYGKNNMLHQNMKKQFNIFTA